MSYELYYAVRSYIASQRYLPAASCGNFYALTVKKVFLLKMCQSNYTGKFKHTGVSAANTDKLNWRESLYVLAVVKSRRGFLRGRIREVAVEHSDQ